MKTPILREKLTATQNLEILRNAERIRSELALGDYDEQVVINIYGWAANIIRLCLNHHTRRGKKK